MRWKGARWGEGLGAQVGEQNQRAAGDCAAVTARDAGAGASRSQCRMQVTVTLERNRPRSSPAPPAQCPLSSQEWIGVRRWRHARCRRRPERHTEQALNRLLTSTVVAVTAGQVDHGAAAAVTDPSTIDGAVRSCSYLGRRQQPGCASSSAVCIACQCCEMLRLPYTRSPITSGAIPAGVNLRGIAPRML